MNRRAEEIAAMMEVLHNGMRDQPQAGVVAGTLCIGGPNGGWTIDVAAVDFEAIHWVALADSALEWAANKMKAEHAPDRDLIMQIHAARAVLGFEVDSAPN